jgi:hypothetical protein
MPVRVIFRCQFCSAVPDTQTQRSLEGQLREGARRDHERARAPGQLG